MVPTLVGNSKFFCVLVTKVLMSRLVIECISVMYVLYNYVLCFYVCMYPSEGLFEIYDGYLLQVHKKNRIFNYSRDHSTSIKSTETSWGSA